VKALDGIVCAVAKELFEAVPSSSNSMTGAASAAVAHPNTSIAKTRMDCRMAVLHCVGRMGDGGEQSSAIGEVPATPIELEFLTKDIGAVLTLNGRQPAPRQGMMGVLCGRRHAGAPRRFPPEALRSTDVSSVLLSLSWREGDNINTRADLSHIEAESHYPPPGLDLEVRSDLCPGDGRSDSTDQPSAHDLFFRLDVLRLEQTCVPTRTLVRTVLLG
jgi:hypothetical protein